MQKIFIVVLIFYKRGETPVHNNHFVTTTSEALALDSVLKEDESLCLIKKGYSVAHSGAEVLNIRNCPQNSPYKYGHLYMLSSTNSLGVYINLQVPQTPELLEDLAALMQKHYQYTLPTTN